jgi:preprotein translocase subunit SecA
MEPKKKSAKTSNTSSKPKRRFTPEQEEMIYQAMVSHMIEGNIPDWENISYEIVSEVAQGFRVEG